MKKTFLCLSLVLLSCLTKIAYSQNVVSFEVFFNTDSFNLSIDEQSGLNKFIATIDSLQISRITIAAYCDDTGKNYYNIALSNKRAGQIKEKLIRANFKRDLIDKSEGNGSLPLLNSSDKTINEQRKFNRRAEIKVFYTLKENSLTIAPDTSEQEDILTDKNVGDKIILGNILFVPGSHKLLPESFPTLDSLTYTLKNKTQYQIKVIGYVCCINKGDEGFDYDTGIKNLSHARARVIYDYLINHGVDSKRLQHIGLGSDPTDKGDKYDRRVEIEVTGISDK